MNLDLKRLLLNQGGGIAVMGGVSLFDWYVDSVNGNDLNTGKSSSQAFQTIAALEAAGVSAGQSIGLAKGSEWREQLDITVDNITIEAYGTGNSPILRADNVAANASFSKTGGQTNVYEISVTPAWFGVKDWLNAWEDDVYLTRAADLATCDATPGSYFPSAATGTITLYVHASDSSDVTANGKVYEYTQRARAFLLTGTGGTVSGITFRRNLYEDGVVGCVDDNTFSNCSFLEGSKHNLYVGDGCTVSGCTLSDAYYNGAGTTLAVHNKDVGTDKGVSYLNNTFSNSTYDSSIIGINGHVNASGTFGLVTITGNTFTNMGKVITAQGAASSIIFSNNIMTDCGIGVEIGQSITYTLSGNTYTNLTNTGIVRAVVPVVTNATTNITGDTYNVDNPGGGIIAILANDSVYNITDCLLQATGATATDGGILINTGVTGITLTLNGTSFISNAGNNIRALAAPGTYTGNNNCYGTTNNTAISIRWGASTYTTLAAWQAVTSQDANSTVGGCS